MNVWPMHVTREGSLFILLFLLGSLLGCTKERAKVPERTLSLRAVHHVGRTPLRLKSERYRNKAGNEYRVSGLEYLLSDFVLTPEEGEPIHIDTVLYVNPAGSRVLALRGIPADTYKRIACSLGLPSRLNEQGRYHDRKELAEMAWPEQMGGGYHFMRFEGHFKESSQWRGFALHLGKDGNHIRVSGRVELDLQRGNGGVELRMDLNEWFEGRGGIYDLQSDPVYSMSNDTAMRRLSRNGASALTVVQGE